VRALLARALLVASVLVPRGAGADPATEVRFFDELGRRSYEKSKFPQALESFLLADDVAASPRSLYNVGLCADLAHDDELAFAYLHAYLVGPDTDEVRRADARARAERLGKKLALVEVITTPPGAEIMIDRAELGTYGRAPRTVSVPVGEHRVLVSHPGHRPASTTVRATKGNVAKAVVVLVREVGTLEIKADPPSLAVELLGDDGTRIDVGSKPTVEVPVGRYRVLGTAPGHKPAEALVSVITGATTRATLVARELPKPTGTLLVSTGGVPARILVDGKPRAAAPARIDRLPVGEHRIDVEADGYLPLGGTAIVSEEAPTLIEWKLTRAGR
jgi:outer membrane receptor for ferrienterochelin and colicins